MAAREIAEQQFSQPLMAKAYAIALGDPDKTRALYIGMRADQLKQEANAIITLAQAKEKERKTVENELQKKSEREREEVEKLKKKAAAEAERSRKEIEAQRAGDAWSRGESFSYHSAFPRVDAALPKLDEKPKPAPPMTPEELEKVIESLKEAQKSKRTFLG